MKYKKYWFPPLFVLPLVLGIAGYVRAGERLADAVYGAFALYFVNPVAHSYNLLVGAARWLAPLMMAGGVFLVMKAAVREARAALTAARADSFAVCGDSPLCDALVKAVGKNAFYAENGRVHGAKNAVLLFENEADGFAFFNENRRALKKSAVYLRVQSADAYASASRDFTPFNLTELAMGDFWLRNSLLPLLRSRGNRLSVVLVGDGAPAHRLLENAVLNNIFTPAQEITYHVFGDVYFVRELHGDLRLMNGDRIVCHDEDWRTRQDVLDGADRIVFTDPPAPETLLALAERCRGTGIFCRGLNAGLPALAATGNLFSFGDEAAVLTAENVKGQHLYAAAKRLNFAYARLYGGTGTDADPQTEWDKLDAFTRHSNVASAAYHRVRLQTRPDLSPEDVDDALAELEHVRWCRFHFWHHWKTGAAPDGKKDAENRLHPCLVPFEELSRTDKNKDIDAVKVLLSACGKEN